MTTLTRQQREIQERDALVLDIAQKMRLERGYLGFNMDRVAEATEYSKGTISQHLTCKEDMIAALLLRSISARARRPTRRADPATICTDSHTRRSRRIELSATRDYAHHGDA